MGTEAIGASAGIVGREPELAAVARLLSRARERFAALLLEGEAGIGKTTVFREALRKGEASGFHVLACRPGASDATLSLAAVSDLLHALPAEPFEALPRPQRRALEVALLRSEPGERPVDQRAVAAGVRSLVTDLAAERPVLLAVDDVQWLDAASAAILEFVLRRLGPERVGLLAMRRLSEPTRLDLEALLPPDALTREQVGPLSLGALQRLLRERLGVALPRSTLVRVHGTSRGNPLFALEIGRVLMERGTTPAREPLPVPADIRELVGTRVAALPQPTRELLLAAALLAQPDADTLRSALGRPLDTDLDPAERAGIAVLDGGVVAFAHPLHAAAVVASATAAERRRMHRRLAKTAPELEERARHLALAVEGSDETAATTIHAAAREAFLRGAPAAAAELAELALETGEPESPARPERVLDLAAYLQWAAEPARARTVLEAIDDWTGWSPALRARAWGELLASVYWSEGAVAAAERGERMLGESPPAEVQAVVHAHLSHYCEFDLERAAAHGDAALALFEMLGDDADPAALARALTMRVRSRLVLGLGLERRLIAQVLRLEERVARERPASERVSSRFGQFFKHVDDLETSREWLERYLAEAIDAHDEIVQGTMRMHLALTECWAGNLRLALEHLAALERIGDALGSRNVGLLSARALVQAHVGDADAVRSIEARALAEHGDPGEEVWGIYLGAAVGLIELSLGNGQAADERFTAVLRALEASAYREPGVFRVHGNAAEAAVAVGDLERAEQIAANLADHAERTDHRWSRATSERVRALVSAARGDLETALAHAERALSEHDGLPMPFERARTLLVKGVIERRARRRARARLLLEEAASEFERMGAQLWAERARNELERVGGRRPSGEELTPAEQRVVALATEGLSNKAIAQSLFVSVHTVEVHLSHAYAKLGVRSRGQLARHLAGRLKR